MVEGVNMNFTTFTFVLDDIARNIVDGAIARGYKQVGTVTLSQGNKRAECVTKIYAQDAESSSCLIHQCGLISDTLHSSWSQLFLNHAECRSCLILSGLPTPAYNSDMSLGGLRVLYSSTVEEQIKTQFMNCTTPLETGNMLSGCTAAVLCQCEYRALEAVVCVSLRGLAYTYEAAMMFENISPQASRYLNVDETLALSGNNALHSKMVKADQFLSRTENMYI